MQALLWVWDGEEEEMPFLKDNKPLHMSRAQTFQLQCFFPVSLAPSVTQHTVLVHFCFPSSFFSVIDLEAYCYEISLAVEPSS